MAAILELRRQIEKPTPSIDAYFREEGMGKMRTVQNMPAKFYPDPIWNDERSGMRLPQQEQQQEEQPQEQDE